MDKYYEEEKELLKSFLNRTFFKDWDKENKSDKKLFNNLELQINTKCNLNCSYCYYNNLIGNGKDLYPVNISKNKDLLKNTDLILEWLDKNSYLPGRIDIFSGEPLNQDVSYEIIEKCIDFYSKHGTGGISVPTNFSFLRDPKKLNKVLDLKENAYKNKVSLGLSASVDGKYMDIHNRKLACGDSSKFYDDKFYDDLFSFAKNYGCGFHPMVYYDNIEEWPKNFDWFQDNFAKYGLPWQGIYLLEVRNDGWNRKSINHYIKFYKHVLDFIKNKPEINDFITDCVFSKSSNMNLFNNTGKTGRGIGCSLQTTMFLRLGDLTVNPCHRQSYDWFNGFKFHVENDEIVDVDPINTPFYLATFSMESKSKPMCQACLIKNICNGGCNGAQYEVMGDPFTPIPSVCALEHGKVKAQIEWFTENNLFNSFLEKLMENQRQAFIEFKKIMEAKNE